MKAHRIHWADRRLSTIVDLGYRYSLPQVHCDLCRSTWGDGDFEYPTLRLPFLNERDFTYDRVITVAEFARVRKRICRATGRDALLVPGGSLGEPFGESITTRLQDFAWGRLCYPQISKRACELLLAEGIKLNTATVSIRCRGKKLDTHLALQVDPYVLLTTETLARHKIIHCPRCGDYHHVCPRPRIGEDYEVKRSCWPRGLDLVTSIETLHVLASEEFMETVKRHKLTGLAFVECGHYV